MLICSYVAIFIGCDMLISEHLELYSLNFLPVSIPLFNKGKIPHSLVSKDKVLTVKLYAYMLSHSVISNCL